MNSKPNAIQIIVVFAIGVLSLIGLGTLCWCAIFKIYIEPTMMISLNGLTFGLAGSLTTLLVGRTVQQLNQSSDTETTMTQTTQTVIKPKPQDAAGDLIVTQQPEVAISDKPQPEIKP